MQRNAGVGPLDIWTVEIPTNYEEVRGSRGNVRKVIKKRAVLKDIGIGGL